MTGRNEEIAEIVTRVLGDLSLAQAEIHLKYQLSREAIRSLKAGKIGRESTMRTFAEGFWSKFHDLYASEIRAAFGICTPPTVSDWFAQKAGYALTKATPATATFSAAQVEEIVSSAAASVVERLDEAVEGVLARAYGWRYDEEFGKVARELAEGFKPIGLASLMRYGPDTRGCASAILRGYVPDEGLLIDFAAALELPVGDTRRLFEAAGREWDPYRYFAKSVQEAFEEDDNDEYHLSLPMTRDPAVTAHDLRLWVNHVWNEKIRIEESWASADVSGNWHVSVPKTRDELPTITFDRRPGAVPGDPFRDTPHEKAIRSITDGVRRAIADAGLTIEEPIDWFWRSYGKLVARLQGKGIPVAPPVFPDDESLLTREFLSNMLGEINLAALRRAESRKHGLPEDTVQP